MYLELLSIDSGKRNIRTINFHYGMNLIVDETNRYEQIIEANDSQKKSGNNIGKTTVLKLVNFCLGGDRKEVYTDTENNKNIDRVVESFLSENKVVVTLVLREDLNDPFSQSICIKRNFLLRNERVAQINGKNFKNDIEFTETLKKIIYPDLEDDNPTFPQLIANNIRYKDVRINNTINNLHGTTKPFEYEALYLYMLGCPVNIGKDKLELQTKMKQELAFSRKLQQTKNKSAYTYAITIIKQEIAQMEKKKKTLNINEHYNEDLDVFDQLKMSIRLVSSQITNLKIKEDITGEGIREIEHDGLVIGANELKQLYEDVLDNVGEVQKTFDELVAYHNIMLKERLAFLEEEQSQISNAIRKYSAEKSELQKKELIYAEKVKKSDTLSDLDKINQELNEKFRILGEYENVIKQITNSEKIIEGFDNKIKELEVSSFSEEFTKKVVEHVNLFNKYFSKYSKLLYGETFMLQHTIKVTREGQKYYSFNPFSMSTSSGKKQGEALSFDLAYIEYAQNENISHLDFLLNDKKELMDINQIIEIANLLNKTKTQLVISILQDKLPDYINTDQYVVLRLSQDEKLFKIENQK